MAKSSSVNSHASSRTADNAPASPTPTLGEVSSILVIACLFTLAGGYMDAYSYLAHGHVFANAQTGNFVFFGVYASGGQWTQATRHLPPIAAFAAGVAISRLVGVKSSKHSYRATLICQAFELSILIMLGLFGFHLPDALVVPILSFLAAVQNTSLDKVGPWSFNSAMTTGNLRDAVSGFALWLRGRDVAENRGKGISLGLICGSFLVGALCGGGVTRMNERYALLPCAAIVAVGFMLTFRERRRNLSTLSKA